MLASHSFTFKGWIGLHVAQAQLNMIKYFVKKQIYITFQVYARKEQKMGT